MKRSMLRKISPSVAAGALLMAAPVAFVTSPAAAAPTVCEPNTSWWKVSGSATRVLTHSRGYQLPPGGRLTLTKSAEWTRTLTAGIKVSTGATVSADGVIGKAEAKYDVELAASGSATKKTSESVTFSLAGSKKDRYYAPWAGRRYWTGSYARKRCSSDGKSILTTASGRWRSYQVNLEGAALCPASRYATGSLPYKACKATWG
jgi:hypothetical protein